MYEPIGSWLTLSTAGVWPFIMVCVITGRPPTSVTSTRVGPGLSVFTVRRPAAASAFTLMALGLAAGVSGAGAMRAAVAVAAGAAALAGAATTPLGRMAS